MKKSLSLVRLLPFIFLGFGELLQGDFHKSQELVQRGDDLPPGTIQAYAISDDGQLGVVADYEGNLLQLDLRSGQAETLVRRYPFAINEMVVAPGLSFFAFPGLGEVVWVSLRDRSQSPHKIELGSEILIEGLSVSPGGEYLAGASYSASFIFVWNLMKGTESNRLAACEGGQRFTAFTPDGRQVAAVCQGNIIRVWDLETSHHVRDFNVGADDFVNCIRFSRDGRHVIASTGRKNLVLVFDLSTGEVVSTLRGHTDQVYSLGIQAKGSLVTASEDETVRVWNMTTGKLLKTFKIPNARVPANGSIIMAQAEQPGVLELWDVRTGRKVRTFNVGASSQSGHARAGAHPEAPK